MSEVRGYPNPDYTEEDIREGFPIEAHTEILLDDDKYIEYVQKSAMFDCLVSAIRTMGKVDETVVYAITGTYGLKENEDLEKFRSWWHEEHDKNERISKENESLKQQVQKLQDQINQLLPAVAEDQEEVNG